MAFDPLKLSKESVLRAAKYIDTSRGLKLNPSTVYDVIINNRRYPPKEIIRYAYRLTFNEDVGRIYGGEQVNEPLRALGFAIERKQSVWKLGCNWGRGAPSFYDFIKRERIVISHKNFLFEVGDLIAVTEGFTVRAIARVIEPMSRVISIENYLEEFQRYDIDYDDNILFSSAEWYELQETEIFSYELQQGIRRIQSQGIFNKVVDTWDNRNKRLSHFIFYSKPGVMPSHRQYPCFVFDKIAWDDYGYRTTYLLKLFKSPTESIKIGHIKILQTGINSTELPAKKFTSLNKTFCSLGQSIDFYQRLKSEVGGAYRKLLKSINDCAFDSSIRREFQNIDGFKYSLLRTSEAELALETARQTLLSRTYPTSYYFDYSIALNGASAKHEVGFSFNSKAELPNRFFCLVGRNGTGKTNFIKGLANDLVEGEKNFGSFSPERPIFSRTIAISFSYFDTFLLPKDENISYTFIGIKRDFNVLSDNEVFRLVWDALRSIFSSRKKKQLWIESLTQALEFEYLSFNIQDLEGIATEKEFRKKTQNILSSGQNIIFQIITQLIASIEPNSLILFDEPETHLHPSIAGRMIRTINSILNEFESFSILATHSPVVVQEIPSKFIRIFDRTENTPIIYQPPIECLGENLSTISNTIFQTDKDKELYKQTLESLAAKFSDARIQKLFDNKLSLNASIFLKTISVKKK